MNDYSILGVKQGASIDETNRGYKKLKKIYLNDK